MKQSYILIIYVSFVISLLFSDCATTKKTTSKIDLTEIKSFNYSPRIKSAELIRSYKIGSYSALVYGNIESIGRVEYLYILALIKNGDKEPCFLVSSEVNAIGFGGSHFLCYFDGKGHSNLGVSNDWADLDLFVEKALSIVADRYNIADSPQKL